MEQKYRIKDFRENLKLMQYELEKIINDRLDKQAKKYEAEKSDAQKLAKMNADDKQKY